MLLEAAVMLLQLSLMIMMVIKEMQVLRLRVGDRDHVQRWEEAGMKRRVTPPLYMYV
jgi:hypothetical protein